jgi:hypothetical protein
MVIGEEEENEEAASSSAFSVSAFTHPQHPSSYPDMMI